MNKDYHEEGGSFTCQRCGCDFPLGMMDYEEEDMCVYCVEDDERSYPDQDY